MKGRVIATIPARQYDHLYQRHCNLRGSHTISISTRSSWAAYHSLLVLATCSNVGYAKVLTRFLGWGFLSLFCVFLLAKPPHLACLLVPLAVNVRLHKRFLLMRNRFPTTGTEQVLLVLVRNSNLKGLIRELFLPLPRGHAAVPCPCTPTTSPMFPFQGTRRNNLLGLCLKGECLRW